MNKEHHSVKRVFLQTAFTSGPGFAAIMYLVDAFMADVKGIGTYIFYAVFFGGIMAWFTVRQARQSLKAEGSENNDKR